MSARRRMLCAGAKEQLPACTMLKMATVPQCIYQEDSFRPLQGCQLYRFPGSLPIFMSKTLGIFFACSNHIYMLSLFVTGLYARA